MAPDRKLDAAGRGRIYGRSRGSQPKNGVLATEEGSIYVNSIPSEAAAGAAGLHSSIETFECQQCGETASLRSGQRTTSAPLRYRSCRMARQERTNARIWPHAA